MSVNNIVSLVLLILEYSSVVNMQCLIFLVTIALASARVLNLNDCEGIIVNGITHEKVVLKEGVSKPYQLVIDYNTNILYFSYSTSGPSAFDVASLNLKTNEFGIIQGVKGGFANTVDETSHSVYIGASDGIYKLTPNTFNAVNTDITDKNIWQLFYKDGLYFTTFPNEEAYVYKNSSVSQVAGMENTRALLIGVDKTNNIIFSNSSGLFYYTKEDGKTAHIGDQSPNGITRDINGNIFLSSPTRIYSFDEKTKEVKELASITNIFGMAIESDGSIIYASDDSIIRLISTGKECISELDVK